MLKMRKSNLTALLETGYINVVEDEETGQKKLVTSEEMFVDAEEINTEKLVELCEFISVVHDVTFGFKFVPNENFPWQGGIYKWNDPLPMPETEEEIEAYNASDEKVELYKFKDRWMSEYPDVPVFDRDLPNLLCQLLTSLAELDDENNGTTAIAAAA